MTLMSLALLAQAAQQPTRTTFEWGRIQENSDLILPVVVCLALMLFVRAMYRRDSVELPTVWRWVLTVLRTTAILGLLILYLQPQWRSEREVVYNSRVMLLADTSLSMGLSDAATPDAPTRDAAKPAKPVSRIGQVAAAFQGSDLLRRLRQTHDVFVLRFSESLDRDRVALPKTVAQAAPADDATEPPSADNRPPSSDHNAVDWDKFLAPSGTQTQLGAALRQLLDEESGRALSGIVLFSDGGQNAGIAPEAAINLAQRTKVPIFTVGLGSDRRPTNVRVSDLVVPARAYPGDSYTVTGFVQAQGLAGQVVQVQLLSGESATGADTSGGVGARSDAESLLATRQVTLGADGEVLPVKFELTPEATGHYVLCFRVQAPPGDSNPDDDHREADIEIVDRKNHVLLLAGGPTREYRFLRNLLYRDRSTTVDVLLQSGQPGMSQEADKLLDGFPATREEMFDYDCLVAFDPDWRALSTAQVDLLEQWVAEQGGGLIVIAGPVFTGTMIGSWVEDPAMAKVRALYPVEFHRRFSVLEESAYVTEEPWPLEFTREGLEAEYLWLGGAASSSGSAWASFPGVYSFSPVKGPKPGATVLARFSDPRAGQAGRQPVFFAAQFYGSGRVFYMGSGEMWRLRRLDEAYFEQFYTKLIRHVAQGRLLRGSSRGVLLVGQDRYLLGNTVEVRAQLLGARLEPLRAASAKLQVIDPHGSVQLVTLRPDPTRVGTYAGRFPVLEEGGYRLELPVPESDDQRLTRRIQVNVPDLERENPQRNDALLTRIAAGTGGKPYVGLDGVLASGDGSLAAQLKDRTKIEIVPDAPDTDWETTWLRWMMLALCGVLCTEWLIRRLLKLA